MPLPNMRDLLEAGIHFGHQTRRWNPKMAPYIHGQRNGIYIIDLKHTLRQIMIANAFVRDTVAAGGIVLFVGTKKQAQEPIAREAERCGMYYVNSRWLGGTLTNWETVRKSIKKLLDFEELETSGRINQYSKKEGVQFRKERARLEKNLSGIKSMPRIPDIVFVIDTNREDIAVHEAERLGIPCIGIVDTNSDPDSVPLAIPGNDDAIRAVNLYCSVMANAVIEGRMHREKDGDEEQAADEGAALEAEAGEPVAVAAEAGNAEAAAEAGRDENTDTGEE